MPPTQRTPSIPPSSPQPSATPHLPPPTFKTTQEEYYCAQLAAMQQDTNCTLLLPYPVTPFSSSMSAVPLKSAAHSRKKSDELDVFDAAGYYSGLADGSPRVRTLVYGALKEDRSDTAAFGGGTRRSIDVPIRAAPLPPPKETNHKEKKTKQPISPGGRFASFLNSFFHQGSSKKKSKSVAAAASSNTAQQHSCKSENSLENNPGGRTKKRIVSQSRSTESSNSLFSSESPASPRMKGEDARIWQRLCSTVPAAGASAAPASPSVHLFHAGRSDGYGNLPTWERSRRASTNGIPEKGGYSYHAANQISIALGVDAPAFGGAVAAEQNRTSLNKDYYIRGVSCRDLLLTETPQLVRERSMWRRWEEEDGWDSDSSSDLFELPNCGLQAGV